MENIIVNIRNASIYQDKSLVLEKINFKLYRGEFTYLIGKTGSGKSSLLKTIYGALPLKEGKGEVVGFDLTSLNRRKLPKLRRKLGIVFQDFNLLSDRSAYDNLRFVLRATDWYSRKEMKARMEEVLREVALSGKGDKMPHELSGGEQQRLVIARALLNKPQLIIADEPTGNLDPETSDEILALLRRLAKNHNTAILFATHDYRVIERFPARVIRCRNKTLVVEEDYRVTY